MLRSQLCTYNTLTSDPFLAWADRLRPAWDPDHLDPRPVMIHRKMWEWLFIANALEERGVLGPGKRGLGFGVGKEPLVAAFAKIGCQILATDLPASQARSAGWTDTGQEYAGGLDGLNVPLLCPPDLFFDRVTYRDLNMTDLPADLGEFDFTWSSCAFEHLGSLDAGIDFVVEQMRYVSPGGVAVHTTECNLSSNDATIDSGATVLYRRADLDALARRLLGLRYRVDLDLGEGDTFADRHVDVPPFSDTHLRTTLGDFVTTSAGLIIENPVHPRGPVARLSRLFTRT
ncbi:MAG: methyltransferase domain-containing protein [Actinobacteria bacterium]|nr:methyltransferase domain-containing protein [Actinomycetota bacterium]